MRLLKRAPDGSIGLTRFRDDQIPRYAILSHTWTDGQEITYQDLLSGAINDENGLEKTGYQKIRFCVDQAAADGLEYCWVDTCCIDKSISEELSAAINSMFRWYQRAAKCYVYLPDVEVPEEVSDATAYPIAWTEAFRNSRWFTRGWTLQELLAPASVEFFSKEQKRLGSKISLEKVLHEVTKLPIEALRQTRSFKDFSVEERFQWAAARQTTVKEDKAYCLLGIFDIFLPLIYGEGENHAMQRVRDEVARRQQGAGTNVVADVKMPQRLPFPRNEFFTGRVEQLHALDEWLNAVNGHRHLAIHGLGGCGKSALAIEFAYRTMAVYAGRLVFWVPAISHQTFEHAYREIGEALKVPGLDRNDVEVKSLVKKALDTDRHKWLMIVDNADDNDILMEQGDTNTPRLYDYLPRNGTGKILFTTRTRKVAERVAPRNVVEIQDPGKIEARQILEQRISNRALLEDEEAVQEFLSDLACLPLAIVQAAAFINENDISISEYVSMLREKGTDAELFGEQFEDSSRYQEMESTIARTWHISFEQIRRQDPLAGEYLSFMACIDRSNIPLLLLPEADSRVKQSKAIGTLKAYAFITERQRTAQETTDERYFDIHRLIHMASRSWLIGQGKWMTRLSEVAARAIGAIPSLFASHSWDQCKASLPHGTHIANSTALDSSVRGLLLFNVGEVLFMLGQYPIAEDSFRAALRLTEMSSETGTMRHIRIMRCLAQTLEITAPASKEAEVMLNCAKEMSTNLLGPQHFETILLVNELGRVLLAQQRIEEAEKVLKPALTTHKEICIADFLHGEWLAIYNNLANAYMRTRRFDEAEALQRHACSEALIVYGETHHKTRHQMLNLTNRLCELGKLKEAEDIARRVWSQTEDVLGPGHREVSNCISGLATVLDHQGRCEEALVLTRMLIERDERLDGSEHISTLVSVTQAAALAAHCGLLDEAEQLFGRALKGLPACIGEDHPLFHEIREGYLAVCGKIAARTREPEHEGSELNKDDERESASKSSTSLPE